MGKTTLSIDNSKTLQEQINVVVKIVMHGTLNNVKDLVKKGLKDVDLSEVEHGGYKTLLQYAAFNKDSRVICYLIDTLHLDPDACPKTTPLLIAAHCGNLPVIHVLIDQYGVDTHKKTHMGTDIITLLKLRQHFELIPHVKHLIAQQHSCGGSNRLNNSSAQAESSSSTLKHRRNKSNRSGDAVPPSARMADNYLSEDQSNTSTSAKSFSRFSLFSNSETQPLAEQPLLENKETINKSDNTCCLQ